MSNPIIALTDNQLAFVYQSVRALDSSAAWQFVPGKPETEVAAALRQFDAEIQRRIKAASPLPTVNVELMPGAFPPDIARDYQFADDKTATAFTERMLDEHIAGQWELEEYPHSGRTHQYVPIPGVRKMGPLFARMHAYTHPLMLFTKWQQHN